MTTARPLPFWRLLAFSSLALPLATAGLPVAMHIPAIYSQHHGLTLGVIGLVFVLGRLWDAISDPLVGVWSDHTRSRFGRRKPWIAAGGIVFLGASGVLFFPVGDVSAVWLAVVLFVFYLGWTAVQIPFMAWSGEISGLYHERTRVATFQAVVASGGLFVALIVPTVLEQVRPGDASLKLSAMGFLVIATTIPALVLTLTSFKEAPPATQPDRFSLRLAVSTVARDKLLRKVLASDFAVTLGQTIRASLIVFFVTFYMGRPEWASGLYLLQFSFGILAAPLWHAISKRIGKHRAAVGGEVAQVLINAALLLVTPDTFAALLGLTIAQGLTQGSGNLMLRAMVADIADRQKLISGEDRTALYFSVFSLAGKAATAVAVGFAFPVLALSDFDPALGAANPPAAMQALLVMFALGPAMAHGLSAALLRGFDLDEKSHTEIRRKLEQGGAVLSPAE